MPRHYFIGRKKENDLILSNTFVSGVHARMWRDSTRKVLIEDLGSANHLYAETPDQQISSAVVDENSVFYFSKNYRIPGAILLEGFRDWEAGTKRTDPEKEWQGVRKYSQGVIRVGSLEGNDVVLPFLSVMDRHVEILQGKDGRRYLKACQGVAYVNGIGYRKEIAEISPDDEIEVGGVTLSLNFDRSDPRILEIGCNRAGIYIGAEGIDHVVKDRETGQPKSLLEEISLFANPGEFIALLGPSGCGKTTLLTVLSGCFRPTNGVVRYNGTNLMDQRSRYGNQIGYVPQDDIMHSELTVFEILYYQARLRLPKGTSDRAIKQKINQLCLELGLVRPKDHEDLRHTRIGSPSEKTLSGGQRKRVNLAIELLTDPRVLFLDEPTSGLSSTDTRLVIDSLRRLSRQKQIAIIITIHQPAPRIYRMFDHAIYLKFGKMAYFGPAYPDSIEYFLPTKDPEKAGPDGVMEEVEKEKDVVLKNRYLQTVQHREFVEKRRSQQGVKRSEEQKTQGVSELPSSIHQFIQLLSRDFKCKIRDRMGLAVTILQAPMVAVLLALAFFEKGANAPLFLMGFVSIWFGTNNAAREVVGERDIFTREKRSGLSGGSYLLSKFLSQGGFVVLQSSLLFLISNFVLDFSINPWVGLAIAGLCGLIGVAIGLLVSAMARTEVAAIATVPLILIPFILLGGFITPYDFTKNDFTRALINLMPTRWAYEAMVQAEHISHERQDWETDDLSRPTRFYFQEFSRKQMLDGLQDEGVLIPEMTEAQREAVPLENLVINTDSLDKRRQFRIFVCFMALLPFVFVPLLVAFRKVC